MNRRSSSEVMIESRDLAVGYGEKTVLAALNIQIQAGQFISLLGPNGAGKTTLLKTLARLLSPRCSWPGLWPRTPG